MNFADYVAGFEKHRAHCELSTFGQVQEGGRDYPLLRARTPGRHLAIITSGFHGEEPAGPLTLLEHFPRIVEHARAHDVALLVYPCINPSGFEDGTRYNRSGEKPNNDLIRYEIAPGEWKGELVHGEPFLRWALFRGGPKETKQLAAELDGQPTPNAALDLHQDRYLPGAFAYAYTFGPKERFAPIVEKTRQVVTVAERRAVDEHNRTDENGLITFNDGSVTDYYFRRGTPFAAALETTTHTPLELSHQVNLIWIRAFIELAAEVGQAPGP